MSAVLSTVLQGVLQGVLETAAPSVPETPPSSPTNLLSTTAWQGDTNTTLTWVSGFQRATRKVGAASNPRVLQRVTNLTVGATYQMDGILHIGTAQTLYLRAGTDIALGTTGRAVEVVYSTDDVVDAVTFVATATTMYVGAVGVAASGGQWFEINEDFSLIKL